MVHFFMKTFSKVIKGALFLIYLSDAKEAYNSSGMATKVIYFPQF